MQISESRISFATRATLFFWRDKELKANQICNHLCAILNSINEKGAYVIREKKRKEEVIKLINFNI